ncbi:hypothetical protein KC992_00740 [Candidatus Saccharibacteria bacterium]|nr:hypothetical protein [Candidatus Saccharibacteria bacterium]
MENAPNFNPNQDTKIIATEVGQINSSPVQVVGPDGHIFNIDLTGVAANHTTEPVEHAFFKAEEMGNSTKAQSHSPENTEALVGINLPEITSGNNIVSLPILALGAIGAAYGVKKGAEAIAHKIARRRGPAKTGKGAKSLADIRRMEIAERAHLRLHPEDRTQTNRQTGAVEPVRPYSSLDRWGGAFHRETRNPGSLRGQDLAKANSFPANQVGYTGPYRKGGPLQHPEQFTPGTNAERRFELGIAKHANRVTELHREAVKEHRLYGDILDLDTADLKRVLSTMAISEAEKVAILKSKERYDHALHKAHEHEHVIDEARHGHLKKIPKIRGPRLYWLK